MSGDLFIDLLSSGDKMIVKKKNIDLELVCEVSSKDNLFTISAGAIKSGTLELDVEGSFQLLKESKIFDLSIKSRRSDLMSYLEVVPEDILQKIPAFTGKGELTLYTTIKGVLDKQHLPELRAEFYFIDGTIRLEKRDFQFEDIELTGTYIGSEKGIPQADRIEIKKLKTNTSAGPISVSLSVSDFDHPDIDLELKGKLDLFRFQKLYNIDTLEYLSGELGLDLFFRGKIQNIKKLKPEDFIHNRAGGEFIIQNTGFKIKKSNLSYRDINALLILENNDILIESLEGKISNSDLKLDGYFRNALAWLFVQDQELVINANLVSEKLILDELLSGKKDKKREYHMVLPQNLRCNIDAEFEYLKFKKFEAFNITGDMLYRNRVLLFDPVKFNAVEGEIVSSVTLDGSKEDSLAFKSRAKMNGVNISDLFNELGNFGQDKLTNKHINGNLSASVFYSATMDRNLKTDLNSIYVLADMTIESGELIEYKPLLKLSKFLKIDDLKHIRFSRLTNLIEIKQRQIIIPEMDIESNAINMKASGWHTFDNNIDYHINLLLSDLVSAKFKKNNKNNSEFDLIEDDGLGGTTLFLMITGSADDPEFGYDTRELKEKIKSDLKDEKQDLKVAMQEEFDWLLKDSAVKAKEQKEKEILEKQEKGEFLFEWEMEEENPDTIKQKKIKGSQFQIEWDEDTISKGLRSSPL
jgi:hypothetical protein